MPGARTGKHTPAVPLRPPPSPAAVNAPPGSSSATFTTALCPACHSADSDGVLARAWAGPAPLVRYSGHWGEPEMREDLARDFPPDWRRARVVRYPGQDPDVAVKVLGTVATAGAPVEVAGGAVELTPVDRGR